MIPLAQYLSAVSDDEFAPLSKAKRPGAAAAAQARPLAATAATAATPRPAATAAASAVRPLTEPRISLREHDAARAALNAEIRRLKDERETAVADALERGRLDGEASARAELEAENENRVGALTLQFRDEREAAVSDARAGWVAAEGERLADLIVMQIAIFEQALRATFTDILRPLVTDARKRQTVEDLVSAVKTLAFDGTAFKISASGPADLLQSLESRLGEHARLMSFAVDNSYADIRIDADSTVIETRLASWRQALEEALS